MLFNWQPSATNLVQSRAMGTSLRLAFLGLDLDFEIKVEFF